MNLERLAGCAFDGQWIIYVTWEREAGAHTASKSRPKFAYLIDRKLASLSTGRGLTAEISMTISVVAAKARENVINTLVDSLRREQHQVEHLLCLINGPWT
jgi:hypothetical protein